MKITNFNLDESENPTTKQKVLKLRALTDDGRDLLVFSPSFTGEELYEQMEVSPAAFAAKLNLLKTDYGDILMVKSRRTIKSIAL